MENGVKVNGVNSNNVSTKDNGENDRPRTPRLNVNSLSLTEYSTNPSPPSSTPKPNARSVIPDDFKLPNGYPDVCTRYYLEDEAYESSTSGLSSRPEFMKSFRKPP